MKKFIYINPALGSDVSSEIIDCAGQIYTLVSGGALSGCIIVRLNIFLKVQLHDYTAKSEEYKKIIRNMGLHGMVLSFVPQAPAKNNVLMELILIDKRYGFNSFELKKSGKTEYLKLEYNDRTEIISGGIYPEILDAGFDAQSDYCLCAAAEILKKEGFTFSDIVRQWNYIGNICECILKDKCINQNYQVFNDIRTKYYEKAIWVNGYPASTGIGIGINTCLIDFIAVKPKQDVIVIPLRNPRQADAHKYTCEVLKGDAQQGFDKATPPKFERGKIVASQYGAEVYVSGTAAILGQDSVENNDAAAQASITIANILELVSNENIEAHGYDMNGRKTEFRHLRVYLKNPAADYEKVKAVCESSFNGIPTAYVQAEVCRFELLVEIEAYLAVLDR